MAFRDPSIKITVDRPDKDGCPFIYNVSQSVGATGVNRRDDVMLVQVLLTRIFGNPFNDVLQPPGDLEPLVVDGWFGPITQKWINFYQQNVASEGCSILRDGRVDRARGQIASISQTVYTINWLNFDYQNDAIKIGGFENLDKDPGVPSLLATAIAG